MNSQWRSRCLVIPGLVVLAGLFGPPVRGDDAKIDTSKLFPGRVGTQWDYVVERKGNPPGKMSNKVAKIETIDGQKLTRLESYIQGMVVASEHVALEEKGFFRYRAFGSEAMPPIQVIKFPVKADESWEIDSKIGDETLTGTCVAGLEEITVPAGKYQTVRVKMNVKVGVLELKSTVWYAENVGMVQQSLEVADQETMIKLEKFQAGKE